MLQGNKTIKKIDITFAESVYCYYLLLLFTDIYLLMGVPILHTWYIPILHTPYTHFTQGGYTYFIHLTKK